MADLNEEMKAIADYAVKSAKERFKLELDFSEQSITNLETILEKIYWGFSNRTNDVGEGGLVFNTAIIWGSYLGEYMRLKWGGNWILKGQDRILSIINIEFSPVNLVYQKITGRPNYSLEDYLNEAKRVIYRSAVNPQEAKYQPKNVERFKKQISIQQAKKPFKLERRLIVPFAGIGMALLLIIIVGIIAYRNIKAGSLSAFGAFGGPTRTDTSTPTPVYTNTPAYTATTPPTDTPSPTITPLPTFTATSTSTPSPTFTPTETLEPSATPTFTPTATIVRRSTRTPTPTREPVIPTEPPQPTAVPPTPVPAVLASCEVIPSTVPAGENTPLTLRAVFTAGGYGFTASISDSNPLASGCSGTANSDGIGECGGSSGIVPSASTVTVIFSSSVGDCSASFSTP